MSDDLDRLIDEIDIALWNLDLKYNQFPKQPAYGDKHTDDDGQTHTWLGPATGWAVIGKDRRDHSGE